MQAGDLSRAYNLLADIFGPDWAKAAEDDLHVSVENGRRFSQTFIGEKEGEAIATIQMNELPLYSNTCSVTWVAVRPDYRGRGISREILSYAEEAAIGQFFKGAAGTFMVIPTINQSFGDYYERVGFADHGMKTHDGYPILAKHYLPS